MSREGGREGAGRQPRAARRSIQVRLRRAVMLTSCASLLAACLAFVGFDALTLRRAMRQEADTLASVLGASSAVALAFRDADAAEETLSSLAEAESVLAGVVYDRQGGVFATWVRPGGARTFTAPPVESSNHRFESQHLSVFHRVSFEGDPVGTIYLRYDTRALFTRQGLYAAIALSLLGIAAAAGAFVSARLRHQIAVPLSELVEGAESVAAGDLSVRVAESSEDEIGGLARTFNGMAAGLRDLVEQVRHNIGEVSEVSDALQASGGRLTGAAQRQQEAIADCSESVDRVSQSILGVNSNVEQLSEAARETSSSILEMDASIAEVAGHMDQLAGSIDTTASAAGRVEVSTAQVGKGVDTLQTATDGALVRLLELSQSVRLVKDNAEETHDLSEDSSQEASRGRTAVNETIAAMREISASFGSLQEIVSRLAEKSEAIDEILRVIGGVAEQTGLLSLNASIIAAQAGEHGRAFSVVADQVSNLAERTHGATREIAGLIRSLQGETAGAVNAVEEGSARVVRGVQRSNVAGEVLERIIEKSRLSTERVRAIVEMTARQTHDLERVDHAMTEVREMVEQIDRSTHDQQAATAEIGRAVEHIRSLGSGVRRSTDEHRHGSRQITEAMAGVAAMIQEIAEATQAQTRSSETIQHALLVFRDGTDETQSRAEAINEIVSTLSERARRLESEIGRFRTSAS